MNKEELIKQGLEIRKISEVLEISEKYEEWKTEVFKLVKDNELLLEQCRKSL